MSFVITLYVREGIVMASDSRLTLNISKKKEEKSVVQVAVGQSDSNYKTFLTPNNIGISAFGAADVEGAPLAGHIESFINQYCQHPKIGVNEVAEKVLRFFAQFDAAPDCGFHVAGYNKEGNRQEQQVWHVIVKKNQTTLLNKQNKPGASWAGEGDVLARLLQPTWTKDRQGNYIPYPAYQIPWQFFTLQDAIDFAVYAVRTTIDSIRFQPRPKTVGGPIDVLVIKPDEAYWIQRKALHV